MCVEVPPAESCVCPAKHYIENWKPISEPLDATPISVNLPVCRLSTCTAVLISATAAACYLSSAFHTGCERKTNLKRLLLVFFGVAYIHLISDFRRKKNNFFFFTRKIFMSAFHRWYLWKRKKKTFAEEGNFVGYNNFGRQSNFCWNWKPEK